LPAIYGGLRYQSPRPEVRLYRVRLSERGLPEVRQRHDRRTEMCLLRLYSPIRTRARCEIGVESPDHCTHGRSFQALLLLRITSGLFRNPNVGCAELAALDCILGATASW
jgi:hypothetical protein